MSFSGTGTFNINSAGQPVVAGTTITATAFNALTADLATGLSTCITKDGQQTVTANIPFANYRLTGVGAGTSGTDAANVAQVQGSASALVTVTGTDTLTGSMTPALTTYATGNQFAFVAANTNTTAVTLNIDGLGAKAVTRDGSTALVAGDIISGKAQLVVYDGTRFQLLNSPSFTDLKATTLAVSGAATAQSWSVTGSVSVSGAGIWGTTTALAFNTNSTEVARFDTSGNLGLGVAPSAWASGAKALQMQYYSCLFESSAGKTILAFNARESAANVYKYLQNEYASCYQQVSGGHYWFNAASGTAGNTITFTQAMTLDTSGNLGIGVTPVGSNRKLEVGLTSAAANYVRLNASSSGSALFESLASGTASAYFGINATASAIGGIAAGTFGIGSADTYALTFGTSNTERARIDSSGNLLVGTTTSGGVNGATFDRSTNANFITWINNSAIDGATHASFRTAGTQVGYIATSSGVTIFSTSSDYRLKKFVAPVTGSGERIDALNPVEFDWKETGSRARGFFAHEFQEVYANSVTGDKDAIDADGKPVYQGMQAGTAEVIADLVAEIKSLRVRLNALENKP